MFADLYSRHVTLWRSQEPAAFEQAAGRIECSVANPVTFIDEIVDVVRHPPTLVQRLSPMESRIAIFVFRHSRPWPFFCKEGLATRRPEPAPEDQKERC